MSQRGRQTADVYGNQDWRKRSGKSMNVKLEDQVKQLGGRERLSKVALRGIGHTSLFETHWGATLHQAWNHRAQHAC